MPQNTRGTLTSKHNLSPATMLHRLREHRRHLLEAADRPHLKQHQRDAAAETAETVGWAIKRIETDL